MKRPADAFARMDEIDNLEFGSVMNECNFRPYLFKLKVLQDNFSDDQRVKVGCGMGRWLDNGRGCRGSRKRGVDMWRLGAGGLHAGCT